MHIPNVVILGLDGGTLELIEPWVRAGKLPNLGKLLEEGAFGELRSTMPAVTAPAWTSFATGKNPGKHSIYDFVTLDVSRDGLTYSNSENCRGEPIWDTLSRHGKTVCVINVPMTYPPHPVNGILITGMMTPGLDSNFVYPPHLQEALKRQFPEYMITAAADKSLDDYPNDLQKMVHARAELAKHLLRQQQWDFFMVVFTATDLVQHMFWRAMRQPSHPQTEAILEIYQLIDTKIGEIQEMLGDDAALFIMSDHGAGPIRKQVHINRWLEENGYLRYKTSEDSWLRRTLKSTLVKAFILWRTRVPLRIRDRIRQLSPRIQNFGVSEKIEAIATVPFDWESTKAYHAGTYANIRINLEGREKRGIVPPGEAYESLRDEIIAHFEQLCDPETGERVVEKVFKREELYHGDAFDDAPDLLIQWAEEAYWSDARFGKKSTDVFESQYKVPLLTSAISAIHKRNGIFIAAGSAIRPHRIRNANITDVAPTILYSMGLPIPEDMDGHPLSELFTEEFQSSNRVKFEKASTVLRDHSDDVFSEEDRKKVEERLKELGYLG